MTKRTFLVVVRFPCKEHIVHDVGVRIVLKLITANIA